MAIVSNDQAAPAANAAVAAVLNGSGAAAVTAAVAAVALPVTGVDPTAVAAVAPAVAAPVVEAAVVAAPVVEAAAPNVGTATAPDAGGAVAPVTNVTPDESVVELTASQKIAAKIDAKRAQITKLTAEIDKLEGQFRSADLLDSITTGSVIKARVGRAETAREVQASVVGVQTLENGDRRLKIFFGEGFDAETVVIQDSQIVDVVQV